MAATPEHPKKTDDTADKPGEPALAPPQEPESDHGAGGDPLIEGP